MNESQSNGNGDAEVFELDESQRLAVTRCADCSSGNRIVPVTGPAGTGKTTIIRIVHEQLVEAGYSVVLCAPTGKAAKRITEATGIRAMTIHRLLEYPHPGERDEKTGKPLVFTDPKRTAKNPLEYDVIIADEYAMVNLEVHSNLVFALPRGGRLLMFGDVNQLRPIERTRSPKKESPFQAGIRKFDGVKLRTVHRFGAGSGIARNGKLILSGMLPRKADDFQIKFSQKPLDALKLYMEESGHDFGSITSQIISPIKKSWVGTYKLNLMLQDYFNPHKPTERTSMPRHKWEQKLPLSLAVGDKIIWTNNSYDLRSYPDNVITEPTEYGEREHYTETPQNLMIMNGETGVITVIAPDGSMELDLGDRRVNVPPWVVYNGGKKGLIGYDPRAHIDLAYVITTHKAQGSEYHNVVYVLNKSSGMIQCRSNLYTAVTRARSNACIITDQQSIQASVTRELNIMEMQKR